MIGARIAAARTAKGWSQQELADKLSVKQPTVQRYESEKRDPDTETLKTLSALLEVNVAYLLGIEDDPNYKFAAPTDAVKVPVFGRIAAGTPREACTQSDETHDTAKSLMQQHKNAFWLTVAGNSMNRLFPEGSLVLVDPDLEVRNGDIGVAFVNGDDATLKRVYFEDGNVRLHPESFDDEYKDRIIDSSDPEAPDFHVVGRVVSYTAPDDWRR